MAHASALPEWVHSDHMEPHRLSMNMTMELKNIRCMLASRWVVLAAG